MRAKAKMMKRTSLVDMSGKQQLRFREPTKREQLRAREHAISAYRPTEITIVPYEHVRETLNKGSS